MNGTGALKAMLNATHNMLQMYLSDLSDTDLQVAAVPGANNIAWQLGHLIGSEVVLSKELGAVAPELPAVFAILARGDSAKTHADGGKLSKNDYLACADRVRKATIAALDRLSEADLDKPNTNMLKEFAPTLGSLAVLLANHTMMHAGQFTVVRRLLKKPVLF